MITCHQFKKKEFVSESFLLRKRCMIAKERNKVVISKNDVFVQKDFTNTDEILKLKVIKPCIGILLLSKFLLIMWYDS